MDIHVAIEDYLMCKRNTWTHDTYKWCRWMLQAFGQWCQGQGITELSQVTAAQVQRFVSAKPALSSNTKHHKAQVVKGFLRWCSEDEDTGVKGKTVRRIEMPKVEQEEIEIYSEAEVTRLLAACEKTRYCLRNRAIVLLLLDTGIRLSELCHDGDRPEEATGLLLENVVFEEQDSYITVMGKGRKTRTVKIGNETRQVLQEYIRDERPESKSPYLFLAQGDGPLSARELDKILIHLGELAHIPHVHAHRFRHTFAIQQLLARTPAFVLMEIMGHTTLESTKIYIRGLSQAHARQASASVVDEIWSGPRSVREVFIREGIRREQQQKAEAKAAREKKPEIVIPVVEPKSSEDVQEIHAQWTVFISAWQERKPGKWLTTSEIAEVLADVLPEDLHQNKGEHPKAFLYRLRTALAQHSGVSYGEEPISVRCRPAVKRGMNLWQVYRIKTK